MKQASPRILVVDDDINVRESLSTILQSEGYSTVSVENAREALEKARNRFFDLVLLDIRLPDAEGAQLLSQFQEVAPETVKIVITGYPSVENAAQALNIGADSYLVKPIDPECLLKTIRDKLKEREQNEKFTTKKLEDWIRLRLFKTESSDFHEFLEKTSKELALFGLTGTQAKIYIGLNALSVASASEIAHLSGIAREEVYRVMPELEKLGLATRRLGTPRRYLATNVKTVLETLIEIKRKAMEGEIFSLRQKKSTLIARLELTTELKTKDEHSTEIFSEPMSALVKLDQMIKKAKRVIMLAIPLNQLGKALVRETQKIIEIDKNQIRIQIITDNSRLNKTRTLKPYDQY